MSVEDPGERSPTNEPIPQEVVIRLLGDLAKDKNVGGHKKLLRLLRHLIEVERNHRIPRGNGHLAVVWFYCKDEMEVEAMDRRAWEVGLEAGISGNLTAPPSDLDRKAFEAGMIAGYQEARKAYGNEWSNYRGKKGAEDLVKLLRRYFTAHRETEYIITLHHYIPDVKRRETIPISELRVPSGQQKQSRLERKAEIDISGSLGLARPIFLQRGLLSNVIGKVMTSHDSIITLMLSGLEDIEKQVAFVADDELVHICGRINAHAFRRQSWGGTANNIADNIFEKTKRNGLHSQRNPYAILLIRAFPLPGFEPGNSYVGFSHVIPLNEQGYARYCDRQIPDNLLQADVICAPGEKARALLLFSIAVDAHKSIRDVYAGTHKLVGSGEFRYQIALMLVRALAYHVKRLMELHGVENVPIELLAQSDGAPDVINALALAQFVPQGKSADGFEIWRAKCQLPSIALPALRGTREDPIATLKEEVRHLKQEIHSRADSIAALSQKIEHLERTIQSLLTDSPPSATPLMVGMDPGIERRALAKLAADIKHSVIHDDRSLEHADKRLRKTILSILCGGPRRGPEGRLSVLPNERVPIMCQPGMFGGFAEPDSLIQKLCREFIAHSQAEPIVVTCASINVASLATLLSLRSKYSVGLKISWEHASGRQQIEATEKNDRADFLITATAPFFLLSNALALRYRYRFPIHAEEQAVLHREPRIANPTLVLYGESSAEEQALAWKASVSIPDGTDLKDIEYVRKARTFRVTSMEKLTLMAYNLASGDLVIAWEPLLSGIRVHDDRLVQLGPSYWHYISLFAHSRWMDSVKSSRLLTQFEQMFMHEWAVMCRNSLSAQSEIRSNLAFLDYFGKGAGEMPDLITHP